MSTPLFKTQVEMYLRAVGEGDITITYTAHVPNNTLKRYSFSAIYDNFYSAGLVLLRVLKRLAPNELVTAVPTLKVDDVITLTTNAGTIAADFGHIQYDSVVDTNNVDPIVQILCRRWNPKLSKEFLKSTGKRLSPSATIPYYEISTTKTVDVYPKTTTFYKITLTGMKALPRLVLSDDTTPVDIWNADYTDMLVDGAVALAKGTCNEISLEQFYTSKLQSKFAIIVKSATEEVSKGASWR